jgi:hypothetical protein
MFQPSGCRPPAARVVRGKLDLSTRRSRPPSPRKWDAVSEELDVRVIGRARIADRAISLGPPAAANSPGLSYYARLPGIVADELRLFRPEVIITKSPYEALAPLPVWKLARPRPKLLVDLHGDWRTAPRLYGSSLRRLYAGLSDRAAVFALRRADGTRRSPSTRRRSRERERDGSAVRVPRVLPPRELNATDAPAASRAAGGRLDRRARAHQEPAIACRRLAPRRRAGERRPGSSSSSGTVRSIPS